MAIHMCEELFTKWMKYYEMNSISLYQTINNAIIIINFEYPCDRNYVINQIIIHVWQFCLLLPAGPPNHLDVVCRRLFLPVDVCSTNQFLC